MLCYTTNLLKGMVIYVILAEKRRKEKINGWITKIASVLFKHCPEKQVCWFFLCPLSLVSP